MTIHSSNLHAEKLANAWAVMRNHTRDMAIAHVYPNLPEKEPLITLVEQQTRLIRAHELTELVNLAWRCYGADMPSARDTDEAVKQAAESGKLTL